MRWLLVAALFCGGCAGRSAGFTPVKRGRPDLIVSLPPVVRFNRPINVRILITGHDKWFVHGTYLLVVEVGPDIGRFIVYPTILRYYDIKLPGRNNFPAPSGSMPIRVTLSPVVSFDWLGTPATGSHLVQVRFLVEMKGVEA